MSNDKKAKRAKKLVIASFLATPIAASLISTLHLVNFFYLGNHSWMSYVLAATFEVGSIASFVSLGVMHKIKKWMVMLIFTILFFMQLLGNVYFVFEYVNQRLAENPAWLSSFVEMIRPVYDSDSLSDYKFVLALMIGTTIPLVSILFLKSLVDYLSVQEDPTEKAESEAPDKTLNQVMDSYKEDIVFDAPPGAVSPEDFPEHHTTLQPQDPAINSEAPADDFDPALHQQNV